MLRIVRPTTLSRFAANHHAKRSLSSKPSILAADQGAAATHVHHAMTTFLVVATPVVFMMPENAADGIIDKAFGIAFSATAAAHSWVGLNYVAADYVPKVSGKLLPPARLLIAGASLVTFLGLSKVSWSSPGGLRGVIKGAWNPKTVAASDKTEQK
mmetsp:Transcript_2125/g.3170  ORF Transcript_2125/g.3170 Transcript_2125/m.3170 type:complete len:156 (+) Transcript_2125:56-523(+)|eukprot:CAMPEP_0195521720 /NCGR_PEP_ID=MMETSP0794_2-20130614/19230_1 /TAXON_ID=515487 /ORGANISM="Stephanopyxis turris, Strain CCMP 815" /LENGTH=155 /DNA_ID=CAMNT_0040651333 /DNA_START=53 /DNA_END=520 /DNA_ORIENTATION=-